MKLDPQRYPVAAAYLASLPQGLESHVSCQVRADVHLDIPPLLASLPSDTTLPPSLRGFIDGSARTEWIPETVANTLMLLVRDAVHKSDEALLAWDYERNVKLFNRPLNRALVYVMSTSLLVMGCAKRWSNFHRGTSLYATPIASTAGKKSSRAVLSFPDGLYDRLLVDILCGAYRAALAAGKAKNAAVDVLEVERSKATFTVSWDD
jgi:hypothetical protein